MQIKYLDIVDWEPTRLRFVFREGNSFATDEFETSLKAHLKAPRKTCSCSFEKATIRWESDVLACANVEWVCPQCLEDVLGRLGSQFASLQCVEIGLAVVDEPLQYVTIPSKTIEFESGARVTVGSFDIQKTPVTVGQFNLFTKATGYVTVAERYKSNEIYSFNQTLSGMRENAWLECYAVYLAAEDATAFCEFAGCRLPTEAEWLSAAIYDWNEYDTSQAQTAIFLASRTRPLNAIQVVGLEFTGTLENGMVVARSGPESYLDTKWRGRVASNRYLVRPDFFNLETGFRIIRPHTQQR